ncbi:MAG: hypothetical protein ACMG57_05530 [Candidatus Dojkabacteria bacterium]
MSEVLSIRNQEHLNAYPGLDHIRNAMIYAFEHVSEQNEVNAYERAVGAIDAMIMLENRRLRIATAFRNLGSEKFTYYDLKIFLEINSLIPLEGENIERAVEMLSHHFQVSAFCNKVSQAALTYLQSQPTFEGDAYIMTTNNFGPTKYFRNHHGNVAYVLGHYYYFSVANIFNLNLRTPCLDGNPFDRSVNIIHTFSYEELIEQVSKLEGGDWPTEHQLIKRSFAF